MQVTVNMKTLQYIEKVWSYQNILDFREKQRIPAIRGCNEKTLQMRNSVSMSGFFSFQAPQYAHFVYTH